MFTSEHRATLLSGVRGLPSTKDKAKEQVAPKINIHRYSFILLSSYCMLVNACRQLKYAICEILDRNALGRL